MAITLEDLYPDEHTEQAALVTWWDHAAPRNLRPLLMAIPNGGHRNIAVAAKLKAEGVRPGVPDMFLAIPAQGFHGLWIELKRARGGYATPEQKRMARELQEQGYMAVICHGWTAAMKVITDYLTGTDLLRQTLLANDVELASEAKTESRGRPRKDAEARGGQGNEQA